MSTFPLQNSCQRCSQTQRRLKIAISDYQFQIKKIQEDKSTDKAMYQIHLQKEVKRLQELYAKEKSYREDQTKNWIDKYDATVAKYQAMVKGLKEDHAREMGARLEEMRITRETKINKLTDSYETRIADMVKKYDQTIKTMKQQHDRKINDMSEEHQNYCTNLKKSHKLILEEKTKSFESRLLGAESERIKQSKLHEQTKSQNKDTQSKLYQQIFNLRKTQSELQARLSDQICQTVTHASTISQLHKQIEQLTLTHSMNIQKLKQESEKKIEENKEEFKNKLKLLYQENIDYCNKYQNVISRIQDNRQSQKAIYLSSLEEVNGFIQSRLSRPDDLEQIQLLRDALNKKTKQFDVLAEQLKFFRLQLQNKQETYNKIFVPISSTGNQTILYKRKQFKLRRQGKSVTTVRQALQSLASVNNAGQKRSLAPCPPRPKIL